MSADSLIGTADMGRRATSVRLAIPTAQIRTLQVPKFSVPGTAVLVVGLSVATFIVYAYLVAISLST